MRKDTGQVLLIIVLVVAVALTVVLSFSFTQRTETQLTKLEEENQKALAVAEAGLEYTLKNGAVSNLSDVRNKPWGSEFTGQTTSGTPPPKSDFASPLLPKGGQYTFYLAPYNSSNNTFGSSYTGTITLYYGSSADDTTCDNNAIEITIISGNGPSYAINRRLSDNNSGPLLDDGNRTDNVYNNNNSSGFSPVDGVTFYCQTVSMNIDSFSNAKFMIVRSVFTPTKIGFSGNANLPPQGILVSSTAHNSNTGVTKKVQLFQSYPQLPTDFFITGF